MLKKLLAGLSLPLPRREGLGVGLVGLLALLWPGLLYAQSTHYTPVGDGKYESYMNFTGQVVENGVPVNGAEVAVFVAGECRQTQLSHNMSGINVQGLPYSIDGIVSSYLAWGQSHKENITFKVWLPGGEERELAAVCPLVVDSQTGLPSAPFILDVGKTAHTAVFNFREENPGAWTFSTGSDGNQFGNVATFVYDGLTVTVTDTRPTDRDVNYVNEEKGLCVAPGGTVTLTAPEGYDIIGAWPLNSQGLVLDRTGSTFGYDGWTGSAGSITLTNTGTKTNKLSGIEVRYAKSLLLGDANSDGSVNIADVTAIINKINGVPPLTFNETAADVNKDGVINIADVTGVINIINQ